MFINPTVDRHSLFRSQLTKVICSLVEKQNKGDLLTFSVCVNIILHSSGERVAVSRRLKVPLLNTSGLPLPRTPAAAAVAQLVRSLMDANTRPCGVAVFAAAFRSIGAGIVFRGLLLLLLLLLLFSAVNSGGGDP